MIFCWSDVDGNGRTYSSFRSEAMLQWEVTVSPSEHLVDTVKNTVIFSGYQQILSDDTGHEDMKKARFYEGLITLLDFWRRTINCHPPEA